MIVDGFEFDDCLSAPKANENLWRAVLTNAIEEAVSGITRGQYSNPKHRIAQIAEARDYILKPNKDFDTVCSLAGLDPEAVRDRIAPQIAAAPSPEQLLSDVRRTRVEGTAKPKPAPRQRREPLRYSHDGQNLTIAQWSEVSGVRASIIRQRLYEGWHISRAVLKIDGRKTRLRISGRRHAKGWQAPGVSFDFGASKGTGAGSTLQETPNLSF